MKNLSQITACALTVSTLLLTSLSAFASRTVYATGEKAVQDARGLYPEGSINGRNSAGKCSVTVNQDEGGSSLSINIITETSAGLIISACTLGANYGEVSELTESVPNSEYRNRTFSISYQGYGGKQTGCEFTHYADGSFEVKDFELNNSATCAFTK